METFLHQVCAGLAAGGIYASLGLALVMVYQSTHHVNFAQGEMAMFSAFIAWNLIDLGLPYWGAFVLTVCISFAMGALVQAAIVRRVRHASTLSVVVLFIGLLVIFHSLAGWLFGYTIKEFPSPFAPQSWYGSAYMSAYQAGVIFVTLLVMSALFAFLRFTPLGLAMRAAAQNPTSSRLVGISSNRMLMLGWGLAAAIGSIAAMLVAPAVFLDPHMMSGLLIYAFAAALIGGIDNPVGAVVGGFIVGVLENLLGTYVVGTELKLSVALFLIVAVLVIRPAGLLGKKVVVRV